MNQSRMLIAGVFLGLLLPAVSAAETLTGQLVDLACYSQNKQNSGNAHRGKGAICGQACAREGFPVGLVTSDGKVYQITGELTADHQAKLVPYISQSVTITGDVGQQNGMATINGKALKAGEKE
jgi:hypothetical protein